MQIAKLDPDKSSMSHNLYALPIYFKRWALFIDMFVVDNSLKDLHLYK